jgi:hypothetical protein
VRDSENNDSSNSTTTEYALITLIESMKRAIESTYKKIESFVFYASSNSTANTGKGGAADSKKRSSYIS